MEQGAFVGSLVSKGEHCPAVPACSVWRNLCLRTLVREGVVCLTFKLWTYEDWEFKRENDVRGKLQDSLYIVFYRCDVREQSRLYRRLIAYTDALRTSYTFPAVFLSAGDHSGQR